jgi:hypothetical protein
MVPKCNWVKPEECSSTPTEATAATAGVVETGDAAETAAPEDGEDLEEMDNREVVGGQTLTAVVERMEAQAAPVATGVTAVPAATEATPPREATQPMRAPSN